MKPTSIISIIAAILLIVVLFQFFKISDLELQNETFDKDVQQLKESRENIRLKADSVVLLLDSLKHNYDSLLKAHLNTPTDVEIIKNNPIIVLDTNSDWSAITNTLNTANADTIVQQ
jgi:hypothetical protein